MLTFNMDDYNMYPIRPLLKDIEKHKLNYMYYVYGVRQLDRPPIRVEGDRGGNPGEIQMKALQRFFNLNNIHMEFRYHNSRNNIYIALRRDVRDNEEFAAAIIRTIIYYCEGKLRLPDYKIKHKALRRAYKAK